MDATDLNLPKTEIDQITERLSSPDNIDPVGASITAQSQKVSDFTLRYDLQEDRLTRLTRALVIWDLYSLMGPVSSNVQAQYDAAMKELTDIRDGKFPDLKLKNPESPDLAIARGKWGGSTKVNFCR